MKLTKRHAQLFLDAKQWALKLVNDEIRDLQKEIQEFETKKAKLQSEIRALENIVKQRTRENAVFQNLKPYEGKH
jgi:predicted  nucleic acid-binding Zn-ribbon protein